MSRIISLAVFIVGAIAGTFVGNNADTIKEQLTALFIPPKPVYDDDDEIEESECTCQLHRPEIRN